MNSRTLAGVAAAAGLALVAGPAIAGNGNPQNTGTGPALTYAVIGDTPYGTAQLTTFPDLVDRVNGDPKVDLVLHVGDIKNGSSQCTDAYFDRIASEFATFKDPLVYTPGDNEWTDCHRTSNGSYLPTERLAAVRETFFPEPGVTLGGRKKQVVAQGGLTENVLWVQSQVAFATIHAVGSNNGLAPWTGETEARRQERLAEVAGRTQAALEWIDATFDAAEDTDARGVVLAMQADMWVGTAASQTGFTAIKDRIAARAAAFDRPVLLIQGDSHRYLVDRPMPSAPNVTRLVIEGETTDEWLRLTIDPKAEQLFSWTRERTG